MDVLYIFAEGTSPSGLPAARLIASFFGAQHTQLKEKKAVWQTACKAPHALPEALAKGTKVHCLFLAGAKRKVVIRCSTADQTTDLWLLTRRGLTTTHLVKCVRAHVCRAERHALCNVLMILRFIHYTDYFKDRNVLSEIPYILAETSGYLTHLSFYGLQPICPS